MEGVASKNLLLFQRPYGVHVHSDGPGGGGAGPSPRAPGTMGPHPGIDAVAPGTAGLAFLRCFASLGTPTATSKSRKQNGSRKDSENSRRPSRLLAKICTAHRFACLCGSVSASAYRSRRRCRLLSVCHPRRPRAAQVRHCINSAVADR
jgi:hypothetical protein